MGTLRVSLAQIAHGRAVLGTRRVSLARSHIGLPPDVTSVTVVDRTRTDPEGRDAIRRFGEDFAAGTGIPVVEPELGQAAYDEANVYIGGDMAPHVVARVCDQTTGTAVISLERVDKSADGQFTGSGWGGYSCNGDRFDSASLDSNNPQRVGTAYAERFLPQIQLQRRTMYDGMAGGFYAAAGAIEQGDWESAAAGWSAHVDSRHRGLAARASHNLAVAAETTGDLEAALAYAEAACQLRSNVHTCGYAEDLAERAEGWPR